MSIRDKINPYILLMRLHKTLPILLILYPTLAALVIASNGYPSSKNIIIFTLGCLITRTLGCIINDIADRDFDKHVKRTENRPLANSQISLKSAVVIFIGLLLVAFVCVLFLNTYAIVLSFIAAMLATSYPFAKRFLPIPQLVLGLAFNFGILMAFAAVNNDIPLQAWLLYLGTICWTIAFDTIYALADISFDKKIGIKSSAIFFGKYVNTMINIFNAVFIIMLLILGYLSSFSIVYFICVFLMILFFVYNHYQYQNMTINSCIKAFSDNHWVGLLLLVAVIFGH